ncbi:MAG: RluA family pseudouridine synthase [Veillonellaceae bacterium]|jgi:23S rRNA pseudouridine1911/1915/1917 synthase|nr:RluA family pseudouridine synthase [Veillonellaceae bacterium]
MQEFIVSKDVKNLSVKDYLRRHIGLSLTAWRKIKRAGLLQVNKQSAFPYTLVTSGDTITVDLPNDCAIQPVKLPLSIKYEDDYLLILDKPANMLVHPAKYSDTETLANAVMYYYKQSNMPYGFHPIHRLDRNTSGLVLVAKMPYIQHLLAKDDVKTISRLYWGIAEGEIDCLSGVIDMPIGRHPESIIERIVRSDGQPAITNYRLLKRLRNASLVELELKTGRTHQIRVHLANIGHPLLGDDLYGGSTDLISRQALHAVRLIFKHPVSGEFINVSSPLPEDFKQILKTLVL